MFNSRGGRRPGQFIWRLQYCTIILKYYPRSDDDGRLHALPRTAAGTEILRMGEREGYVTAVGGVVLLFAVVSVSYSRRDQGEQREQQVLLLMTTNQARESGEGRVE